MSRFLKIALFLAFSQAVAQEPFDPFPSGTSRYHVDVARFSYLSTANEERERNLLDAGLKEIAGFRGRVARSADNLERCLRLYDEILRSSESLDAYLYLRYATDTTRRSALEDDKAVEADVESRTAFLKDELARIEPKRLAALSAQRPGIGTYEFLITALQRQRPHLLSVEQEEALKKIEPFADGWQEELHSILDARAAPTALDPDADAAARARAFHATYEDLAKQRELYAFTLTRLAAARNAFARLHSYEDAAEEAYDRCGITKIDVNHLLEALAARSEVYKRYQHVRAEHVASLANLPEANVWDMSVARPGLVRPRYTIDQAREVLLRALIPVGASYAGELRRLLDPAEGRLDIVPGPNRKRGGFSLNFPGDGSVFYMSGFAGTFNDVRIVAHESTHAVQRQLESGVPRAYTSGPKFLSESYAIFSELLLAESLAENEADPFKKEFFLEQFLEAKGIAVIFEAAAEADIEQALYEGVRSGGVRTADDLDKLTRSRASLYSIWPEKHEELRMQWMRIPLMYEDPFYDVNYVWAGVIALKLYALHRSDPQAFAPRYAALLAVGFDDTPAQLLRRHLGVELDPSRLVDDAMATLAPKIAGLEVSYRAIRTP